MPWRGPDEPGAFPTLGYQVADLIEAKCAIPDGDHRGEKFLLTDEMLRFLLWFYRIDPISGKFFHDRGAQLCRPQKWGKGPFSAAIVCAEADPEGPVRPAGWDANGEPVGRPWVTPEIQITGVTEDNAGNVWRALVPMIELGNLAADIPDTGQTRINIPGGGLIRPVTSAHLSRIGQRLRFVVQDQTESWTASNLGRSLADAQRRNLAGMGGRWLETPNAWDPAENSVAQQTQELHEPGVYVDDVEPGAGSVRNKVERRKMLRKVYGDSAKVGERGWVDLDRIDSEIVALLPRDPAQAERWFLNRKRAAEDAAFDGDQWESLSSPIDVPKLALVTIGVQGRRFDDALVIVGTDVDTSHQFVIGLWERPPAADDEYEHPTEAIRGAFAEAMETYDVWRALVGPGLDHLLDPWAGLYGEKRVLPWNINAPRAAAYAVRKYRGAITAGDLSNDGNELMAQHIGNAKRKRVTVYDEEHRPMHVIGKDREASPQFVNAAWAGVLSWEACGDCIAAGKPRSRRTGAAYFF